MGLVRPRTIAPSLGARGSNCQHDTKSMLHNCEGGFAPFRRSLEHEPLGSPHRLWGVIGVFRGQRIPCFVAIEMVDAPCRIVDRNDVHREVLRDHRAHTDDCALAYPHVRKDDGTPAEPDVVLDPDRLFRLPFSSS